MDSLDRFTRRIHSMDSNAQQSELERPAPRVRASPRGQSGRRGQGGRRGIGRVGGAGFGPAAFAVTYSSTLWLRTATVRVRAKVRVRESTATAVSR